MLLFITAVPKTVCTAGPCTNLFFVWWGVNGRTFATRDDEPRTVCVQYLLPVYYCSTYHLFACVFVCLCVFIVCVYVCFITALLLFITAVPITKLFARGFLLLLQSCSREIVCFYEGS